MPAASPGTSAARRGRAIGIALAVGSWASGCAPARPAAPGPAPTVDEIVAPSPVWEEARDALERVRARHPGTIVHPGEPALQCALRPAAAARVELVCGDLSLAAPSTEELVRQVNQGRMLREQALAVVRDQARLERLTGTHAIARYRVASPGTEEGTIELLAPAMTVRIRVLDRGALRVETTSALGTEPLDATSFRALRESLPARHQALRTHHERAERERVRREREHLVSAATGALLAPLSLGDGEPAYDGVALGLSRDELAAVWPHEIVRPDPAAPAPRRLAHARALAPGEVGTPPGLPTLQTGPSRIAQVELLDGRVSSIQATAPLALPSLRDELAGEPCDLLSSTVASRLHLPGSEVVPAAGAAPPCEVRVVRGPHRLVFRLHEARLSLELQGSWRERDAITQLHQRAQERARRADVCRMCTKLWPGQRIFHLRVLSVDRRACTMRTEVTGEHMPTGRPQPPAGTIAEGDCHFSLEP